MKISKLDDISKNFSKKRLPVSKKVVNLHPDTNHYFNQSNGVADRRPYYKPIKTSTTMRNIEQVNGWYNQALEMSDKLYALMGEIFNDNEIVSYNIEVERWDSRVNIRVFALIGHGKASEELRELAGNFSKDVTFAEYTQQERIDTFVETVATDIKTFVRRAGIVRDIVTKDNEK